MRLNFPLAAVAAGLLVLAHAEAQVGSDSEVALLEPRAESLSQTELETFADIFVELEKTSTKYEMELATVASEREARVLQTEMQREEQQALEKRGWTQAKFEAVSEAVNSSPELLQRTLKLIDERS